MGRKECHNWVRLTSSKDVANARIALVESGLDSIVGVIIVSSIVKQAQWPRNRIIIEEGIAGLKRKDQERDLFNSFLRLLARRLLIGIGLCI
jgi:hypothetical protein